MVARESAPDADLDARTRRKRLGRWLTPHDLVERVVAATMPNVGASERVRVLDPACGDGRFLAAAAVHLGALGAIPELHGVDIDRDAVDSARSALARWPAAIEHADALRRDWGGEQFDIVIGNPPFLSQMAASTTRGGASRHGGGPYADAAAEFLALAVDLAQADGGRVGLVLPQSILGSRDAAPIRRKVSAVADLVWSWWTPGRAFADAQVVVCALAFEVAGTVRTTPDDDSWTRVVTDVLGVPVLPPLSTAGVLGDRATTTANFRDEYYGLVPAVGDDVDGPPLITSGLVDPGRCRWGDRPVRFARTIHQRPRVDLARLTPRMRRWADARLVPKVLVANQTRIIEAVVDDAGSWLPGVPLITVAPSAGIDASAIAAVLTSPTASAWAWRYAAGTGLSGRVLRLGPRLLADLPWPSGELDEAVDALRGGDVESCGRAVQRAYGVPADDGLFDWWLTHLPSR